MTRMIRGEELLIVDIGGGSTEITTGHEAWVPGLCVASHRHGETDGALYQA